MEDPLRVASRSPRETIRWGRRAGLLLRAGDVVALQGELGAGKTTFTKGLALGCGFREPDRVASPTFVIEHVYPGRLTVFHIDAYRLRAPEDLLALSWEECEDGVRVVEWAEKVSALFPSDHLRVEFAHAGEEARSIVFVPLGPRSAEVVSALRNSVVHK